MQFELRILLGVLAVVLFIVVVRVIRKKVIPMKYALLWLFIDLIIVLLALLPDFLLMITKFIGFEVMSNMVIAIFITLLIFITLALTIIVSSQKKRIIQLIQEVSILKAKIDKDVK